MKYVPGCLRNLPPQKSKPKDWERGYNSSITVLELFAAEVSAKQWAGTEGAVVNQKLTTAEDAKCTCGPGDGCTNCIATHDKQSGGEV